MKTGTGGVNAENKTSVNSDRKKTEAACVPMSPPTVPPPLPTRPPPPSCVTDEHMWADNMTLPVKKGREEEREDQEPWSPDIPDSDS